MLESQIGKFMIVNSTVSSEGTMSFIPKFPFDANTCMLCCDGIADIGDIDVITFDIYGLLPSSRPYRFYRRTDALIL